MNYDNYELELVCSLMHGGATPDAIDVMAKITPVMFQNGSFRTMFSAIVELNSKGLEFDVLSVSDKTNIDTSGMIEMMKKSIGNGRRVKVFAKKVRQGYYLRTARDEFTRVIDSIDQCTDDSMIGEIASQVEEAVKNLVVETDNKKPRVAKEILEQYLEIIENRFNGGESERRIRVGVDAIDSVTQGFNLTDLVLIGGCPGMGKTELMMKIVNGSSSSKGGSLVFSMEMDEYQLVERSLAIESGLPISCARDPKGMGQEQWTQFTAACGVVQEKKYHVLDQAGLSVNEIYAQSMDHISRHPDTNAICVDYVGLIKLGKADRHDIALGDVSRKLKQLAKDSKRPVFLLTQVTSKSVESRPNKRPMASDLKDSSRLQDDADWIIFPYRDEVYHEDSPAKGIAEIIFAKARHGQQCTKYMGWSNGHFTEIDQAMAHQASSAVKLDSKPNNKNF